MPVTNVSFSCSERKALLIKCNDVSGEKQSLCAKVKTSNMDHMMLTQGVQGLGTFIVIRPSLITLLQIRSANSP
jgi:hypothetical protein